MQTLPRNHRIALGCGYEPANPRATPWEPPRGPYGTSVELKTCPGYTTMLPEVVEAARAYQHWDKGQLESFLGEPPTELTNQAVEWFDFEAARVETYLITPVKDGGGRE